MRRISRRWSRVRQWRCGLVVDLEEASGGGWAGSGVADEGPVAGGEMEVVVSAIVGVVMVVLGGGSEAYDGSVFTSDSEWSCTGSERDGTPSSRVPEDIGVGCCWGIPFGGGT